jgi:L-ascorbate metabolism protein UlaG (beta-lactamase superfamily)
LIEPLCADDALLADIAAARRRPGELLHVWWLGQSGFLLQYRGGHLLFDPYLSESLTRKYAATDKPHVRMTRRAVDPARLDFVDVLTSSHNHTDHLDAETILPIRHASGCKIVVAAANREFAAERLRCSPEELLALDAGESTRIGPFELRAIPAAHESLDRDEQGRCRFLGFIVQAGPFGVYHSGDTVVYPGLVEELLRQPLDVALLPINGRKPERRVAGNMTGPEAAELAHAAGARLVVPCHYEMFEFNTEAPAAFETRCRELDQPFRTLRCGERLTAEASRSP